MLKRIKDTGFTIIICSFVLLMFVLTSCSVKKNSKKCNCPSWGYNIEEIDTNNDVLTDYSIESSSETI
ncbi:MAG: hypothetical protein KGZ97_05980 [Bacteroidetes bacterium]|nr:hypothetical protein [Bacteroidota bacterium]